MEQRGKKKQNYKEKCVDDYAFSFLFFLLKVTHQNNGSSPNVLMKKPSQKFFLQLSSLISVKSKQISRT